MSQLNALKEEACDKKDEKKLKDKEMRDHENVPEGEGSRQDQPGDHGVIGEVKRVDRKSGEVERKSSRKRSKNLGHVQNPPAFKIFPVNPKTAYRSRVRVRGNSDSEK